MELKTKHKIFCDEYLKNGFNATEAYVTAYQISNRDSAKVAACKLLTNANIKKYIKERQQDLQDQIVIDQQDILRQYLDLIESCRLEGNGDGIVDRTNWNKALQNLSKILGFDSPQKIEHSITNLGKININLSKDKDKDKDEDDQ